MFANIASTLKTFAMVLLLLGIFVSIIAFIVILGMDDGLFIAAIGILLGGVVGSFVNAWLMYGFGELIDKATEIAENTRPASANNADNVIPSLPKAECLDNSNAETQQTPINGNKAKYLYDNAYYKDNSYEVLIRAIKPNISACIIHPNTKVISMKAFEYSDLNNIIIPDGVTTIDNYAFYACEKLTSITIPHSVTIIGFGAFRWCKHLTQITYVGTPKELEALGTSWREGIPPKCHINFKEP